MKFHARFTSSQRNAPTLRTFGAPKKTCAALLSFVLVFATAFPTVIASAQTADALGSPPASQDVRGFDAPDPLVFAGEELGSGESASHYAEDAEAVAPSVEDATNANGVRSGEAASSVNQEANSMLSPLALGDQADEGATVQTAQTISVDCAVIGQDAQGRAETWASSAAYELRAGSNAADLTELMFEKTGLAHESGEGTYGYFLSTITSPFDGRALGYDSETGRYWQLFVNGEAAASGASEIKFSGNEVVTWYYSAYGASLPGMVSATCSVVGVDEQGVQQTWAASATYELPADSSAADLSELMFAATGLKRETGDPTYGYYLNTITSPDGARTLGYDAATGRFWQLFVNGASATKGASDIVVHAGDLVEWRYSASEIEDPGSGGVVVDPDAERPDYSSSVSGFGGSVVSGANTPTDEAQSAWEFDLRASDSSFSPTASPLIVNGDIYVTTSNELIVLNAATGKIKMAGEKELRASFGGSIKYLSRPVYSDGLVIVAADDGSLAAFTADALTCVWKTEPLPTEGLSGSYQSLSSCTVSGNYVYAGFTIPDERGVLVCVDLRDGLLVWKTSDEDALLSKGYYWTGALPVGSDVLVGDDAGNVNLLDGKTGEKKQDIYLGARVRAGMAFVPGSEGTLDSYLVVTEDGVLHQLALFSSTLIEANQVKFAVQSKSTPTVSNGKVFVCGMNDAWMGTLSVVDLGSFKVEHTAVAERGESLSSPLVSVQNGNTYAYFVCNGPTSGVFCYRLGDDAAIKIFTPENGKQQFSLSSVIADECGNLYYTNDSGYLFALGKKVSDGPGDGAGGNDGGSGEGGMGNNGSGNGGENAGAGLGNGSNAGGGFVPAVQAPLAPATKNGAVTQDKPAATNAASSARSLGSSSGNKESSIADNANATGVPLSNVNPWALFGMVVGVAGLAGVGGYALGARRGRSSQERTA